MAAGCPPTESWSTRESTSSTWRKHVASDVVLRSFRSQRFAETDKRRLSCCIVALAEVAEQTGGRQRVGDPPIFLLAHVRPRCTSCFKSSMSVHINDNVPVLIFHVTLSDISKDAGIVDENVNSPKASMAVFTILSPF